MFTMHTVLSICKFLNTVLIERLHSCSSQLHGLGRNIELEGITEKMEPLLTATNADHGEDNSTATGNEVPS
jgi:hypothetical protein